MTVTLDQSLCGGCGNCATVAGAVFELDPVTHVARVLVENPDSADLEAATDAEEECPFGAISVG